MSSQAGPARHFFEVPANAVEPHRLAYTSWGDENNPRVLLCMHGLTRNGRDFDMLAQAMAGQWRIICPDMAGRGASGWLKNSAAYQYPTYLADTLALLGHLGVRRVDWLGTSMGGILGMMAAGAVPGLVNRLVLNDVGAVVSGQGLRRILNYAGVKMAYDSRQEAETALREIFASFGLREEWQWRHLFDHSLVEEPGGGVRMAYDPAIVMPFAAQLQAAVTDIDLTALWLAVSCPVLILRGAESDILTRETAQRMAQAKPSVKFIEIAGAGHAPSLMESHQIAHIRDWFSSTAMS